MGEVPDINNNNYNTTLVCYRGVVCRYMVYQTSRARHIQQCHAPLRDRTKKPNLYKEAAGWPTKHAPQGTSISRPPRFVNQSANCPFGFNFRAPFIWDLLSIYHGHSIPPRCVNNAPSWACPFRLQLQLHHVRALKVPCPPSSPPHTPCAC